MSAAFSHQVGGHASTIQLSPMGSSTLIKPASATELSFYQQLGPRLSPLIPHGGSFIGEWTPAFYGMLSLQGKMAEDGELDQAATADGDVASEMIVLENLTHRFVRPNVLDIKLGRQLFDEDATPEKQARMEAAAKATTSFETGVRLTGFQNWNGDAQAYAQTPKSFGKALVASQLEDGLARFLAPFLPVNTPLPPPFDTSIVPEESKSKSSITPASGVNPAGAKAPSQPAPKLVLEVLDDLASRLTELESILETLPIRMRGGSLLIVTEGDCASLEAALSRENAELDKLRAGGAAEEDEDDDAESVGSSDSQGQALPATCRSLDVRLIDFAHTRLADPKLGESGGDEGVRLGVKTTSKLVAAIRVRVREFVEKEVP